MAKATVSHMQNTGHSWLEPKGSDAPYVHQEYPKRKHSTKKNASVVVTSPDEEKALGPDYCDSPAVFLAKEKKEREAAEAADEAARAEKAAAREKPAPAAPAK